MDKNTNDGYQPNPIESLKRKNKKNFFAHDNRDMQEVDCYQSDRIDAMKRKIADLEQENRWLKHILGRDEVPTVTFIGHENGVVEYVG